MSNKTKPSITRIIQIDYLTQLGILIPSVPLLMYVAIAYFGFLPGWRGHDPIQGTQGAPLFFYLSIIGLVVWLPLAIWRVRNVQLLFSKSVEVIGQITTIPFFRDKGRVEYTYIYQNKKLSGGIAVMKTNQTQQMRSGIQVILLVDPDNPKRVLIRDFYV